jgi:purine catabolism regulator
MFTVRDALELEVLRQTHLVAGAQGLDREVRWVHVVDVPDVPRWVRAGDLLLTTGVSWGERAESRDHLIPALHRQGLAGMILAVGGYLERAPGEMIAQADQLAFPLIELPWDVPFEDIVLAVSERIISAQTTMLRRSAEIHDRFTARVLEGGGFADLAHDLAAEVGQAVLILDAAFAVVASATPADAGPVIEVDSDGSVPRPLVAYVRECIAAPAGGEAVRTRRIPARPDVGVVRGCVLAPVMVGRQTLGYVLAGVPQDGVDDLETLAVERAAMVTALLLYKERAVREAETRMQSTLIDRLLAGGPLDEVTLAVLQRYDLQATQQYAVAVLSPGENDLALVTSRLRVALRRLHQPRLFGERDGGVVAFLCAREGDARPVAQHLVRELAAPSPVQVGLGLGTGLRELAVGYAQAREALQVAARLGLDGPVMSFGELGVLHWVWTLPPAVRADNAYTRKVRLLADYDRAKGADLLATLDAFLRHDGALTQAAAALFVHRHTLTYRLDKIEKLCELDLSAPLVRLNLQVALIEYRLHGNADC